MTKIDKADAALLGELMLDKDRSYGEIFPPLDGAYFEQDGFRFDHAGALVIEALSADDLDRATKMIKARQLRREAEAAERDALAAGATSGFVSTPTGSVPLSGSGAAPADINLQAWADGTAKHQFFAVVKYAKDKHSITAGDRAGLIDLLGKAGIIRAPAV